MDELTEAERDDIRTFVENEDGGHPDLSDLPKFWDAIGPDAPAKVVDGSTFPGVTERELALLRYLVYARTNNKRWAWDGLDRLHKVLMERGDKIPEPLQNHINEAYHGLRKRPPNPERSPEYSPKDDRDFRIMLAIRYLRKRRTREQAIADVAEAMRVKEGKIESVVRKMDRFWREAVKAGN